jgi:hypothetical protein
MALMPLSWLLRYLVCLMCRCGFIVFRVVLRCMLALMRACYIDINAGATSLYEAIANDQPSHVFELVQRAKQDGTLQQLGHFDKFCNSAVVSLSRTDIRRHICAEAGLVTIPPQQYVERLSGRQSCAAGYSLATSLVVDELAPLALKAGCKRKADQFLRAGAASTGAETGSSGKPSVE